MENKVKKIMLMAIMSIFTVLISAESLADKIGTAGDEFWNDQIKNATDSGKYVEISNPEIIASDLSSYKGKLIMFPEVTWEDFYTYRGNKYYYYGLEGNYFIMEDEPELKTKLQRVAGIAGRLGDRVQAIGIIEDSDQWLGSSFVIIKMVAMRFPGKAAIIKTENGITLAGEDIMNEALSSASASWHKDVPKNINEISDNHFEDPEMIVKMFLYYGNVTKNQELWMQSITDRGKSGSSLSGRGSSFWRNISKDERSYTLIRLNEDRSTDSKKYYSYTFNHNGTESSIKTLVVEFENDKWVVTNFPG